MAAGDAQRQTALGWFTNNWNVQTVLAVGAVAFTSLSVFYTAGFEIERLKDWRVSHEAYHKDRAAELATERGRTEERFRTIEGQLRKVDELGFRAARADESISATKEAISSLQAAVASQASDIRVMREILERLDTRRTDVRPSLNR